MKAFAVFFIFLFAITARTEESCVAIATRIMAPTGISEDVARSELADEVIAAAKGKAIPGLQDTSDILADAARSDILRRSRNLEKMIKNAPKDSQVRSFDTVIVGGGPQTSAAVANLDGTRTLVINDSTEFGTFSKFGDTFYINSGETAGKPSPNMLPGGKVQVKDLAKREFPAGRVIGNATEINLSLSEADFLLGHKVTKVTAIGDPKLGKYKIETADGQSFYSNNVIVASGMGDKKFPIKHEGTQQLIQREAQSGKPRIRFVDNFMTDNQNVAKTGVNPLARYAGKRVAVVGPGDGGAITSEYLLGHGPPAGYAFKGAETKANLPKEVFWVGQKAKNGAEYKEATWARYHDLADEIDSGRLKGINGRANRIETISEGPDKGAFRLYYGEGPDDFKVVDEIVVSAGYDQSQPSQILAGLAPDGKPESVKTQYLTGIPDPNFKEPVNLAKQVVVNGQEDSGVYIVGPATGGLETAGEAGGANSPRIEVMGTRTAAVARQIRSRTTSGRSCLTCTTGNDIEIPVRPQPQAQTVQVTAPSKGVRVASETDRETRIRIRLLSAMSRVKVKEGRALSVHVMPGSDGKIQLRSMELDEAGLEKVREIFSEDPELLKLIASQPSTKANREINVIRHGDLPNGLNTDDIRFVNSMSLPVRQSASPK